VPKLADKPKEVSLETHALAGHKEALHQGEHALPGPGHSMAVPDGKDGQGDGSSLRVLHVIDRLGMGGTEYGMLKVIDGLGSGAFEHRVCTVRGFDDELAQLHGLKDRVYVAGRTGAGYQFLLGRLVRIIRAFRPHIVHSRNWGAIEAIPAARLAGVPVAIHSEHGYEVEMLEGLPVRRRLFRRAAYAMADAVFTVTEELRSYHAQQAWMPLKRIRVLPNGVDTCRFAPRPAERADIRQRLGLPASSFVVGAVGRMVKIKDYQTLLQAAETLVARGFPVHVLMVGSGPELSTHQQAVARSPLLDGRVIFTGAVTNVAEALNAMDVFVSPSLGEGMSNTLLEAMASGLPVVVTRVGGNPEIVEEDRSGWLFQPGDVSDLAVRLERLACDSGLGSALGQGARARCVSRFSLEGMVGRYRDLYLELARRREILSGHRG
jgi:sugar transferase (PEP-CTERM/EpsH1 system associated)